MSALKYQFTCLIQIPIIIAISFQTDHIVKLICVLAVWLHVKGGISRSRANIILQAVQLIVSAVISLLELSLLAAGITVNIPALKVPRDVRTAYRHYFSEPAIDRTVCCPKCFSIFLGNYADMPRKCTWRSSPRSRPCNTELWEKQNTQKGKKWVPRCLYTTQSFDDWLQFFLSRKSVEDSLCLTSTQRKARAFAPLGADMTDVQDSPAWKDLHGPEDSPYNLSFGMYIDWFNPYTNKLAGRY